MPFSAMLIPEDRPDGQLWKASFSFQYNGELVSNSRIYEAIYHSISDEPLTQSALTKKAHVVLGGKVGTNRIQASIQTMVEEEYLLMKHSGKNNAKYYSINPDKPL